MIPILNFHWTKVHFVGPLIAPILDFVTLPMGFKVRVVLSLVLLLACSTLFMFNLHLFIPLINMNKCKVLNGDLGWGGLMELSNSR